VRLIPTAVVETYRGLIGEKQFSFSSIDVTIVDSENGDANTIAKGS